MNVNETYINSKMKMVNIKDKNRIYFRNKIFNENLNQ